MVIFNRSHYEDVVIVRVHNWIDEDECKRRYTQINDFERMLTETGTTIIKCFLHISKGEQKKRLQERLDDPEKTWKFNPGDIKERELWPNYTRTYEQAIKATSSKHAPWYIVPADSKTNRNLLISRLLLNALRNLDLRYPAVPAEYKSIKIED
jgi:polyphosphate kinase 2 (PPK2 family)